MSVNKELLEKYHSGTCSAEEKQQVEAWLFNTEVDDLKLSAKDKSIYKAEMWTEIETSLPQSEQHIISKSNVYFMWKGAIAASFFIAILGILSYFTFFKESKAINASLYLNNSSDVNVKHVNSAEYDVSVGPNTNAKINNLSGVIDLSGSILISPKEDVNLVFKGTTKKVTLKKAQTYIILKGENGTKGIIVISERNLLDLPPVMQKQITSQFGI